MLHSSATIPDRRGSNLYTDDSDHDALCALYLPPELSGQLQPHLRCLGALAVGVLDEWACTADKNRPLWRTERAPGWTNSASSSTLRTKRWSV